MSWDELIKNKLTHEILQLIHDKPNIIKQEIEKGVNAARQTMGSRTKELIAYGLIIESSPGMYNAKRYNLTEKGEQLLMIINEFNITTEKIKNGEKVDEQMNHSAPETISDKVKG